ncbi:MAG: gliding motility-associated C-terminal domain-containing protein [Bacteroidales bacterium]|nr:gliding motility-associated C-terminal domain-containing protein [Bacteroidales bacterium]
MRYLTIFALMLFLATELRSQVADDYCETATPICDFNGYYGNTSATYTPLVSPSNSSDEDDTPLGGVFCGSIENNSWLQFMAADNTATLDVQTYNCSYGDGIQMEIYETTDCYNFSSISNCENSGVETDFEIVASPLTPGEIYYLMIDGQAGDVCEYTITALEGVLAAEAYIGSPGTLSGNICMGESVQLHAEGGTNYSWTPTTGLDDPNVAEPFANPTTTTTYTVEVSGLNPWCPAATAEVVVIVDDCGCMTSAGPDVELCGLVYNHMNASTIAGDYNTGWSTASGGVSYSNINSPTTVVTVTTPGTYTFTWSVTNAAGSTCTDDVIVKFNETPTSTFTVTPVSCFGGTTTVNYTGTGPFDATYDWDFDGGTIVSGSGQGPYQISWATSGNHTISLTVTESGCVSTVYTQTLNYPNDLITSVTVNDVDCAAGSNGSVDLTISGGTGGTTVSWSDPAGPPFPAGNYSVTVTDGNGCQDVIPFTVTEPNSITVTPSYTDLLCYDDNSGTGSVDVVGGTPPYTYIWPNGSTTNSSSGLAAGSHTVTVVDNNSCTVYNTITLNQPTQVTASISNVVNATCNGFCDGTATVSPGGGTAPYSQLWSNSQITSTAIDLCLGTYNVTVADNNGCTASTSAVISEPSAMVTDITGTDISCFGGNDGTISVTATGGENPFFYQWNPALSNSPNQSGLQAGTYQVTINDANGCTALESITLTEPATPLTSTISGSDILCNGDLTGSVDLSPSGGTPGYTFLWSNFMTSEDLTNVGASNYFVTITDANGCKAYNNFEVSEPTALSFTTSANTWICIGQSTIISASASGGVAPYTYYWDGMAGTASQMVNPGTTQTYSVYVMDASGCITGTKYVTINVHPPLWVDAMPESQLICPGENASISVSYGGGDGGPYILGMDGELYLSPPFIVSPLNNTQYIISVDDFCGTGTAYDTVEVLVAEVPPSGFYSNNISGCEPYEVGFSVLSPDADNTYFWDYGDGDISFSGNNTNPTHEYDNYGVFTVSLTVTSPDGCVSNTTYENMVTIYETPTASFRPDPSSTTIIKPLVFFHNMSSHTYFSLWDFGDGDSSSITSPVHVYGDTGTFEVQLVVITENGCKDTIESLVFIEDELTFYAPSAFTPNLDNKNDVFFVWGHGIDDNNFQMFIYDRWGEVIYETNQYSSEHPAMFGWNGKVKGKHLAESGTYSWLVIFRDIRGVQHEKAGPVTVIR